MKIINITKDKADVQFSIDELITLNNAINEVCNGIEVLEFEAKMGMSREEAKILLKSVHNLINKME